MYKPNNLLGDLLKAKSNVLDIALDYGFEYEQSYIRAFKNEFHLTPGEMRKKGEIVKVTPTLNFFEGYMDYLPSVPVKNLESVPQGYKGDTFEASLCVRYRYVGRHHFDLSWDTLAPLYSAIYKFRTNPLEKYALLKDKVYFERVDFMHEDDSAPYDDTFFQVEWFAPVIEKAKMSEKVHIF